MLGDRVRAFVEEQGFTPARGADIPVGSSNEVVARAIARTRLDLIVLPFHLHRGRDGSTLDGVSVLLQVPERTDLSRLTLLMPVGEFSWGASFHGRFEKLKQLRANFIARIVLAHEGEIGTTALAVRLRRTFERRRVTLPPAGVSLKPSGRFSISPGPLSQDPVSAEFRIKQGDSQSPSQKSPSSSPISGWMSVMPPSSAGGSVRASDQESEEKPESARERFRRAAELGARARISQRAPRARKKKSSSE
jgi:hypothetical protein